MNNAVCQVSSHVVRTTHVFLSTLGLGRAYAVHQPAVLATQTLLSMAITLDQAGLGTARPIVVLHPKAVFLDANPLAVSWNSCKPGPRPGVVHSSTTNSHDTGGRKHLNVPGLIGARGRHGSSHRCYSSTPFDPFPTSAVPRHVLCVHIVVVLGPCIVGHKSTAEATNSLSVLFP